MATGTRRRRRDEFTERPGGVVTFSATLLRSAESLLVEAFRDRSRGTYVRIRGAETNHATEHAVGAVVMLGHAFEAWLNETVADLGWGEAALGAKERPLLGIADCDLVEKVERLGRLANAEFEVAADLRALVGVRNEFVHHLPRWFENGGRPDCVEDLERRGLLVHADGEPGQDFGWVNQVISYRLAWWAFETVEATTIALGRRGTYRNFSLFRQHAPPPDDLPPWSEPRQ